MKIKLFTDSDLDGISCAILAKVVFGDENVDIVYSTPKDINQQLSDFVDNHEYNKFNKVFITDLVIKEETANKINNSVPIKFKLFDHHKSNYVNSKFIWTNIYERYNENKTCGTELFWCHLKEYYYNDGIVDTSKIDAYVEYVRLWDTWDWTESGEVGIYAKQLNTLLNMYDIKKFSKQIVDKLIGNDTGLFITEFDMNILEVEEARKKRYITQKMKNVHTSKYKDMKFAYVFAENYISELGNYICKNMDDISFTAIINLDTKTVSLRALSGTDIDLSQIAKSLNPQGGGHPLSAGFSFKDYVCINTINDIFHIYNDESTG